MRVQQFPELVNAHRGKDFLIVGAGGTLKTYGADIKKFMTEHKLITIGINNITRFTCPDYHVWTNTGRFREYGNTIHPLSTLIIKRNMDYGLLQRYANKGYHALNYIDDVGTRVGYHKRKGRVEGPFRTAGCLSIYLAHLMGARNIYVIGMDGYTFVDQNAEESGGAQHFYGTGHSDNTTDMPEYDYNNLAITKDSQVYMALDALEEAGVEFKIITPTVFENHHKPLKDID